MLVNAPQVDVQQASLQSIDIGQVAIGPISVGDLVISNTDFSMDAGQATIKNMDIDVTLSLALKWGIHVHINKIINKTWGETTPMGSVHLNMPPLDVVLPSLTGIHINIPTLTAESMSVQADPLNLHLTNVSADQVQAKNVVLPPAGFAINGLSLNSVQGTNIDVPAAKVDEATVNHLHGDPVTIGSFALHDLNLPTAKSDSIVNTAPVDVPTVLTLSNPPGFDIGLLKVTLLIVANANAHIPFLEINDVKAHASVGRIELHNVTLPYDVLNLTLSQVGINSIGIPAFSLA